MRFDLPTGAPRLYGGADGIDHVLVNGAEIVDHGEFTDARPGHAAALGSRHRDRHRSGREPASAWRNAGSSTASCGAARVAGPGRVALDVAPGLPERDVARVRERHRRPPPPARHDDAAAPKRRWSPTRTSRSRTTGGATSWRCSPASSGPTRTRSTTPCGRCRPRRPPFAASGACATRSRRPPTRCSGSFTGLDGGVKFLVDLRGDVLAPRRRRRCARRARPRAQGHTSRRCSTSGCSRCAASRGTRRPRCSRSSSRTKRCTRSVVGRPEESARLRSSLLRVLPPRDAERTAGVRRDRPHAAARHRAAAPPRRARTRARRRCTPRPPSSTRSRTASPASRA